VPVDNATLNFDHYSLNLRNRRGPRSGLLTGSVRVTTEDPAMQKGFFASLFDVSFSSLITTKVIKAVYVISMIVIGFAALVFIIAAAVSDDGGAGAVIFALIVVPIFALLYLIYTRIILEVIIVLFRIMESNVELVEIQRRAVGPATPAPTAPPATPQSSPPPPESPPAG
jgi:Domain of unknown function (DUF4282)